MFQYFSFLHYSSVHLRDCVFYLSSATAVIVFISLMIALFTFQKSKPNLGVEVVWAVVPFVMLFVMMVPIINMH